MNRDYRTVTVNGREIFEHRYVMEQHLDRTLDRSEQVHHRNGDRKDNRIENLELIDASTHGRLHSPPRTHCRRGHLLSEENTYIITRSTPKSSYPERWCRICTSERRKRAK